MIKNLIILFLIPLMLQCNGQENNKTSVTNQQKTSVMHTEILDIARLKKLAAEQDKISEPFGPGDVKGYEYEEVVNGATVTVFGNEKTGYVKDSVPPFPDMFFNHKEYDTQGKLTVKGDVYKKGGFKAGIWHYINENGREEVKDYEEGFPFTYKDLEKYIASRRINMETNRYFEVNRGEVDNQFWYLVWEKAIGEGIQVEKIDGKTGKVVDTFNRNYPEE